MLLAPITFIHSNVGLVLGLKAFPAAVLGGFGSIPGAVVGGVMIGVIESMAGFYLPQGWKDVAPYIVLLVVLLLSSKGAAGVTGSGFIVLAATLSAVGHLPVAGLALILGIDRFMSEARALTNLVGNGVATIVIAKSEGEFIEPSRAGPMEEI